MHHLRVQDNPTQSRWQERGKAGPSFRPWNLFRLGGGREGEVRGSCASFRFRTTLNSQGGEVREEGGGTGTESTLQPLALAHLHLPSSPSSPQPPPSSPVQIQTLPSALFLHLPPSLPLFLLLFPLPPSQPSQPLPPLPSLPPPLLTGTNPNTALSSSSFTAVPRLPMCGVLPMQEVLLAFPFPFLYRKSSLPVQSQTLPSAPPPVLLCLGCRCTRCCRGGCHRLKGHRMRGAGQRCSTTHTEVGGQGVLSEGGRAEL